VWHASTFATALIAIATLLLLAMPGSSYCSRGNTSQRLASSGRPLGRALQVGHRRWVKPQKKKVMKPSSGGVRSQSFERLDIFKVHRTCDTIATARKKWHCASLG